MRIAVVIVDGQRLNATFLTAGPTTKVLENLEIMANSRAEDEPQSQVPALLNG